MRLCEKPPHYVVPGGGERHSRSELALFLLLSNTERLETLYFRIRWDPVDGKSWLEVVLGGGEPWFLPVQINSKIKCLRE